MAYGNNSDGSYSDPDVGTYSNTTRLKDLDFVFILPTGDVWQGETFQLDDGTWVTGSKLTKNSIVLAKVSLEPEFPNDGLVAKSEIFKQVFEKIKDWSVSSETSVNSLNSKLIGYENTLTELDTILDLSFDKIVSFIQSVKMHNEEAGQGQINDWNLNFMLDPDSSLDLNTRISSITYVHGSSTPTYIWDGYVNTGLTNNGINSIDNSAIRLDMVSRTGAPVPAGIDALLLDYNLAPGFSGKIDIDLSQVTTLTSIKLPCNGLIDNILLDDIELINYTQTEDTYHFVPTIVNKVSLLISHNSADPFISYISNDLTEDLLGNPQIDQTVMDPAVYQKSSLDLGPVRLSSLTYKTEKVFDLGPYDIKAGSLRSISINPQEELDTYIDLDSYFEYYIVVSGVEYKLTPWNRNGNSPRIYYVNVNLSNDVKSSLAEENNVGFIDTDSPEIRFNLKIKLIRPEETHLSPVLKGITVNYSTSLDGGYNG